jgi:3-oxoacyl-[acyl-carrier protein] reductase
MSGRLENRAALVIGAARGIGRGIAERFLEEGANVVIADRDDAA